MLADQPWHLTRLAGGTCKRTDVAGGVYRKDQRDLCRQTNLGVRATG